jgi:ABC-type proline/glycine betaine transport system ATPase subunit
MELKQPVHQEEVGAKPTESTFEDMGKLKLKEIEARISRLNIILMGLPGSGKSTLVNNPKAQLYFSRRNNKNRVTNR